MSSTHCPNCGHGTDYTFGATTSPDPDVTGLPLRYCPECNWSEMVSESEVRIGGRLVALETRVKGLQTQLLGEGGEEEV